MKARRQLLFGLVALTWAPAFAQAAPPWQQIHATAHEAALGCRRCRCVYRCVPVMPRVDEGVGLRLNFEEGPRYFAEFVTETKQIMKVMGQEVKQTQEQTFYLQWTPEGVDQDGHGTLKMKIIAVKMKIDIGGVKIEFDSTAGQNIQPAMMPFLRALVDAEFTLRATPQGEISSIQGSEATILKLAAGNPQMEPLLKSIVSEAALKQMNALNFDFVPKRAVRRGDTWERRQSLDLGPIGTYRTDTRYTYDGKVGPHDKILSQTTLKYEAPKEKGGLPFTIQNANLRAAPSKGVILFDASKGRLVSADRNLEIDGTITIEVGGMITVVELRQMQTNWIRVTDTNPLAPKR